jgi:hypothetical protein
MRLDDIAVSRRSFLHAGLATAGALILPEEVLAQENKQIAKADEMPVLKKSRISYDAIVEQLKKDPKGDAAGKYEALKYKYLDQILVDEFKLVADKKRNPDGIVKEWFYWQDPKQQKKAIERIKADAQAEGDTDIEGAVRVAKSATSDLRIYPRYRDPPGQFAKIGYLLVDNTLFQYVKEADVFSMLDEVIAFSNGYEKGIKNADVKRRLFEDTHIALQARTIQIEKILSGERKVSADFSSLAREKYLNALSNYHNGLRQLKNSEGDGFKKEYDLMTNALADINARMQKLGYEHKLVDAEKNTWDLVRAR